MSNREEWKKFGWKEYVCPICKRNKGMIYLLRDGSLGYVCFCGTNISVDWIKEKYDFDNQIFSKETKDD